MTAGRRAPAHHVSAADLASQQHALNAALGNLGKQKPWMTSSTNTPNVNVLPPVVKRKPQPTKSRTERLLQPPQVPSVPASPTVESPPDRHPPSNSTSPQLANVFSHQSHRSPLPSPNVVLPSPAPSEETNNDSIPTLAAINENILVSRLRGGDGRDATAPDSPVGSPGEMRLEIQFMERLREAAGSPKRPIEMNVAEANKLRRLESGQSNRGHISNLDFLEQLPINVASQAQARDPLADDGAGNETGTQQLDRGMHSRPQSPSVSAAPPQIQGAFGPPRALSRGFAQHPSALPSGNHTSAPQVQSPLLVSHSIPSEYLSWEHCLDAFESFLSTYRDSPAHPRDKGRLDVLRAAIDKQDWAYLTLHQSYCLLNTEPQCLPQAIHGHPNLGQAIKLMRDVLDGNEKLSSPVLFFFANFPLPAPRIKRNWPRRYEQEQRTLFHFITCSTNYDNLSLACQQRKYPPLAGELVHDLGIVSIIFQKIVFTAILRRIWSYNGPRSRTFAQLEGRAIALLHKNQTDFLRQRDNRPRNAPSDYENQERALEHQQWGVQLRQVGELYASTFRFQGSDLPHQSHVQPHHPSRGHPQNTHSPTLRPSVPIDHGSTLNLRNQLVSHGNRVALPSNHGAQTAAQLSPPLSQTPFQARRGRPRIHGHTPPHMAPHLAQPGPQRNRPLLPNRGVTQPQPVQPRPDRSALHLAHLRSPLLRSQLKDLNLYQYVKGFAKRPARLAAAGDRIEQWILRISSEELRTLPADVPGLLGEPASRVINLNTQIFRLRCVKWTATDLPDEHAWAIADTSWIPYTYFTFNGIPLHPRKKLHYGKDLPIDISSFITEGENTLEIAVLPIEIVGVTSHDSIKQDCLIKNHVPAASIIETIKRRLSGIDEDDEIAIVENNLKISLFDPFSASAICNIPVRGKSCLHYDCFDLQTFLQTRRRKGDASDVDQWKCPICSADARPQFLITDGFLQDVRARLEQQGLLKTRTIIVDKDGNWKPKAYACDTHFVLLMGLNSLYFIDRSPSSKGSSWALGSGVDSPEINGSLFLEKFGMFGASQQEPMGDPRHFGPSQRFNEGRMSMGLNLGSLAMRQGLNI
ncbi:uncharacterized protein BDR25DRAFT_310507 [Lindgomyces ingoldianus]|uniref:Uncharacterized protein n=1 Tax=Lindgomyces ingoldianus TaxID=673940 RepID=A0ACB6RBM8_9PLEO|nr:uncharacterized protein BDR25DRAFT_310507 [Lindgomyces ingoldianus]KAF2476125.1 hypothetical protein BDR25DRAFT_310507 [Lindgomyces ingoldianus]